MTKRSIILISITISFFGYSQDEPQINSSLKEHVEILSSKKMEGRRAGSSGEEKAAKYLVKALAASNIHPLEDKYLQSFEFNDISQLQKDDEFVEIKKQAHNIVGYIDNQRERSILLGAHYDHLGKGYHVNSRSTIDNPIHFGADDNASGVVSILDIAQRINDNDIREQYNVIIVFFSAEEIGLLGSKSWLNEFKDNYDIAAMINLDMVGRMSERKVQLYGAGTSPSWSSFRKVLDSSIHWEIDSSGIGPSDHASFYLDSIPALHFFTGQHVDYHKETDTFEKLNYEGMATLIQTIYQSIIELKKDEQFLFTATKNKPRKKRASLKVTLGIMPDYSSDGSGLLINGIIDDRPAQKAKMLEGDKITQIDNKEIKDIYDYMEALSGYEKGDKAQVTIIRNNKTKTLLVHF